MSTSCSTSPTATQTQLLTTASVSTTFTSTITTLPGTPTPVISTSCAVFSTPTGTETPVTPVCVSTGTSTISTRTVGESVVTTQVPVLTTITTVQTQISTLYGSSCTVLNNDHHTTSTTVTKTTVSPTTITPTTVITSETSSTLADGAVTVEVLTRTSTLPPTSYLVSVTATSISADVTSIPSTSTKPNNLGAVVGGAVGGAVALLAIILLLWCFIMRRRRRWDDIFEKDIDNNVPPVTTGSRRERNNFSLAAADLEPKPYEYGAVGMPTLANSPPLSPEHRPTSLGSVPTYNTSGAGVSAHLSPNSEQNVSPASGEHSRSPSGVEYGDGYFNNPQSSVASGRDSRDRKLQVMNSVVEQRASVVSPVPGMHIHSHEGTIVEEEGGVGSVGGKTARSSVAQSIGGNTKRISSMGPYNLHGAGSSSMGADAGQRSRQSGKGVFMDSGSITMDTERSMDPSQSVAPPAYEE